MDIMMNEPGSNTQVNLQYANTTESGQWTLKKDTSILISDQGQFVSHRKIIRRWNQLSRLQRSLLYAVLILAVTSAVLFYRTKLNGDINKTESKEIWAEQQSEKYERNVSSAVVSPELEHEHFLNQSAFRTRPRNLGVRQEPSKNISQVQAKDKEIEPQEIESLERPVFTGPSNARQYAVVQSFKHAWKGYKEHAWGHDNLKPVSGMAYNWFSLGLTIVDGLDTAYIMGLNEEYEEGKKWIDKNLEFTKNKDVNFFEVTIRVLGALLTNYHFSKDKMFLEKAKDLGERLMEAFRSPSGIPYSDVDLGRRTAHAPEWSQYSTTAEITTVQLEFRELSRASGNPIFEEAAASVSQKIHALPKKHGLVPTFINPSTGQFLPHATITLGARADSYYEYLLKQWLQTGKTINYLLDDYLTAIEGVREFLAKRSSPNRYLFIGELSAGSESFIPKMDHLVCFLPGTLALGHANGLPDWHMTMAEELLYTCYLTYSVHPTFLAPEITHFNMASTTKDMYTKTADAHSLLRPEFIESLWYMYQFTGNTTYQEWGWQIYQSIEKYARVQYGYSSLDNVKVPKPVHRDMMETFFISETLKYLYMLLGDDRYILDLNKYVMNTEAHPLPIHKS